MNTIGLHPVALECKQHSFPPGRVKPSVYPHVVAHKDGVQRDARVAPLEKVAHLQVLQVSVALHAKVGVSGVGHSGATCSLGQGEADVTAGASCPVLRGAGGAEGAIAHRAGNEALARWMFVRAGATVAFLAVHADLAVLRAV